MNRKEEIIKVTLELASEKGLSNVSMAQIAEKMGIRKPSLYNHFHSKEEIIDTMYEFLRNKSKENLALANVDYGQIVKDKTLEEVLKLTVNNYKEMSTKGNMFLFYKIIYSERAINPVAAKVLAEETERMIVATKNLFYALQVHGKIKTKDVDMTATSFAMTVHSIMDYQLDCVNGKKADVFNINEAKESVNSHNSETKEPVTVHNNETFDENRTVKNQQISNMLEDYIKWFCSEFVGD